ncbi:hypothetical protein [Kineococcus arenarius]|uniref:hypothetical protein n=1 Tax=Kineococcus sp. SYSU DK007 TaxID=3383128 RepID=UPI003D7E2978
MPASSLIFLVIVALWAAYLVPSAIHRRRHAAEARVEDRDSEAMRVVVRQGSAPGRLAGEQAAAVPGSSRPVLAGSAARPQLEASAAAPVVQEPLVQEPVAQEPRVLVHQPRTSRVVRRRRRLLTSVLGAAMVTWALVLASVAPAWAALVPTAVLALVVVALRRHAAQAPVRVAVATAVVPSPAAPLDGELDDEGAREEVTVLDDLTAQLERELAQELAGRGAAVPSPRPQAPAADASAWEPVEVPLPTYLLKPRARVVRPASSAPLVAPATGPVEVDVEVAPAAPKRGRRVIDVRERARVVNG